MKKKILFSTIQGGLDYLNDGVFHGLHQLGEFEITDAPRMWYMYRNEFQPHGPRDLKSLYGRGFTMWGHMDEDPSIDRNNIEQKIIDHYFDLIIVGRPELPIPYLGLIMQHYKEHEIIALSGSDHIHILPPYGHSTFFIRNFVGQIVDNIHPAGHSGPPFDVRTVSTISFGFPKQKIQTALPKTRPWSDVLPLDMNTGKYIYDSEQEYYDDYRQSLFGKTRKKGGWDCMRHYEIMACRCVPYFEDLADAPADSLTTLPRELLLHVKRRVDEQGADYFMPEQPGWEEYQQLEQRIFDHFLANCTTDSLARYVLDTHQNRIQNR
jgi:hypothetical protein